RGHLGLPLLELGRQGRRVQSEGVVSLADERLGVAVCRPGTARSAVVVTADEGNQRRRQQTCERSLHRSSPFRAPPPVGPVGNRSYGRGALFRTTELLVLASHEASTIP